MNKVINAIEKNLAARNIRFVFPSQTAAVMWARKICSLGITRSVETGRFLAWDRFKEEVVREKETKRLPASALARKLFAEALVQRNAAAAQSGEKAGRLPFKSIIPPEYAGGGGVFVPFIARLIPSLAYWEKLIKKAGTGHADSEDEDYKIVKSEYAAFLDRYGLFEPSWEETKIRESGARYIIFFPELIDDFSEYGELLKEPRFIRVNADAASEASGFSGTLLFYKSAKEEIRGAVMELQRLHDEEGVPYEEMAVSVPGLEEMEPYLLKEFYLRHIPVTRRAGKKLGETGAGRLFALANEWASSRYSFNSLKALILNDHIPWKNREKNKALINFGIEYNCVSGYDEGGGIRDIWEDALKEERGGLRAYYANLKEWLLALAGSKNFAEIKKNYFSFRGGVPYAGLLDMEKIPEEDDAILSRCIEELGGLIELEKKFNDPELTPRSPFSFFISTLNEIEYVKAKQEPGVNIFKWRVAAASPFECHFVLNASQSASSVIYQPVKFLRHDKRKALGIKDTDATGAFFLLSCTGEYKNYKPRVRFSASAQTFSGWAIPHSFFARGKTSDAPPCPNEPYGLERAFWKESKKNESPPRLEKLFALQKRSFEKWEKTIVQKKNSFSLFCSPVPAAGAARKLLGNAILDKDGLLTVSPTRDLNVYYRCPLSWLYERIFKAKEFSLEAALLDDTSLGILYHKILEKLFSKIKDKDGIFYSKNIDAYKNWTLEITKEAIGEHPAFKGPLAAPLVFPQAAGMSKKIAHILELEAKSFDGYRIAEIELPVSFKSGELRVKGVIDRISVSPDGEPVIVDYKTSVLPVQTGIEELTEEASLSEFQMPLYIKLYEETLALDKGARSVKVEGAFFYSINNREIKTAMGKREGGKSKAPDRDEYKIFLLTAEKQIAEFGQKVKALDFVPRKISFGECVKCAYKTVCRSAYFLNSAAVSAEKRPAQAEHFEPEFKGEP